MRFEAIYKYETGGGHFTKPVVRFIDGVAMVTDTSQFAADHPTARLRPADSFSRFQEIRQKGVTIAAIPGDGWFARFKQDDGTWFVQRILCWTVSDCGTITPMCAGGDGLVDDPGECSNFDCIYHESDPPGDDPLLSKKAEREPSLP